MWWRISGVLKTVLSAILKAQNKKTKTQLLKYNEIKKNTQENCVPDTDGYLTFTEVSAKSFSSGDVNGKIAKLSV